MRIDDRLAQDDPTVSFEFFPPKTDKGWDALEGTIADLRDLRPDWVDVTYGAGGSTRDNTLKLVDKIQNEIGLDTLAHLTCVGHTRAEVGELLDQLWERNVVNLLALRGDPPGGGAWQATDGGFEFSGELVEFALARHDFCVSVAGFPEGHPTCLNKQRDLEHLKAKCDHGASAVITQLFFDNNDFLGFRDNARRIGIDVPIIAGVMPIQKLDQMKRFVQMCGAKIPHPLLTALEKLSPDDVAKAGLDYATRQCQDLLLQGVDGLHFYTLNKSDATTKIVEQLDLPGHTKSAA